MKTRDKAYHPRPKSPLGGLAVFAAKQSQAADRMPISAEGLVDLSLAHWIAFDEMVRGKSSKDAWGVVTYSLNIAMILADWDIGKEYTPYIMKALEGALRAQVRAEKYQIWRFDGEAISAIREALSIHDGQTEIASKEEMRKAVAEFHKRAAEGNVLKVAA